VDETSCSTRWPKNILKQIVEIQLERVRARLADRHIHAELTDAAR
jgi:ATP-dependent Clp protease ATP-binding subunit ClpA